MNSLLFNNTFEPGIDTRQYVDRTYASGINVGRVVSDKPLYQRDTVVVDPVRREVSSDAAGLTLFFACICIPLALFLIFMLLTRDDRNVTEIVPTMSVPTMSVPTMQVPTMQVPTVSVPTMSTPTMSVMRVA